MPNSMYQILRPLLFRLDPERVHGLTVQALRFSGAFAPLRWLLAHQFCAHSHESEIGNFSNFESGSNAKLAVEVFGLRFPNPVGLAAGYDKDGLAWRGLATLGFGHIEVGTVTPRAQPGNPKPRVFRLPEEQAVINRMGFPGRGAEFVTQKLSVVNRPDSVVLGVNIGKNKDTPNEEAARDYLSLFEKFSPLADYLAVNVSSPNTVGLRRLQARDQLEDLLKQLAQARLRSPVFRPILVKLAPDLTEMELDDALAAITTSGMDGVIATNTTISREGLHSPLGQESGGLSGNPLKSRSQEMVKLIYQKTSGRLPIIGVGGIMNPQDAKMMLDSGATLIQLYTGLIYAGPGLVKQILQYL
jgi:dihydroorotate dehydrogenase